MADDLKSLDITPDTRVGQLLDAHPDLEELLIRLAPAFGKLRNPVIRKTVARVTTLRQAAVIGQIPLGSLISQLRNAVGSQGIDQSREWSEEEQRPAWLDETRLAETLDARPLLETGVPPFGQVMQRLRTLKPGERYELIMPFVPAPLIETARKQSFRVWWQQEGEELYCTYFSLGAL